MTTACRVERAVATMPRWERSLRAMVALHDLAVAGYALTGNTAPVESARRQVVAAIDRAAEAGVAETQADAALARART